MFPSDKYSISSPRKTITHLGGFDFIPDRVVPHSISQLGYDVIPTFLLINIQLNKLRTLEMKHSGKIRAAFDFTKLWPIISEGNWPEKYRTKKRNDQKQTYIRYY